MRTCSCTGYMTNPGGRCCMDMTQQTWTYKTTNVPVEPIEAPPAQYTMIHWLDWDRLEKLIRKIVAEEMKNG